MLKAKFRNIVLSYSWPLMRHNTFWGDWRKMNNNRHFPQNEIMIFSNKISPVFIKMKTYLTDITRCNCTNLQFITVIVFFHVEKNSIFLFWESRLSSALQLKSTRKIWKKDWFYDIWSQSALRHIGDLDHIHIFAYSHTICKNNNKSLVLVL